MYPHADGRARRGCFNVTPPRAGDVPVADADRHSASTSPRHGRGMYPGSQRTTPIDPASTSPRHGRGMYPVSSCSRSRHRHASTSPRHGRGMYPARCALSVRRCGGFNVTPPRAGDVPCHGSTSRHGVSTEFACCFNVTPPRAGDVPVASQRRSDADSCFNVTPPRAGDVPSPCQACELAGVSLSFPRIAANAGTTRSGPISACINCLSRPTIPEREPHGFLTLLEVRA